MNLSVTADTAGVFASLFAKLIFAENSMTS